MVFNRSKVKFTEFVSLYKDVKMNESEKMLDCRDSILCAVNFVEKKISFQT